MTIVNKDDWVAILTQRERMLLSLLLSHIVKAIAYDHAEECYRVIGLKDLSLTEADYDTILGINDTL